MVWPGASMFCATAVWLRPEVLLCCPGDSET